MIWLAGGANTFDPHSRRPPNWALGLAETVPTYSGIYAWWSHARSVTGPLIVGTVAPPLSAAETLSRSKLPAFLTP